MGNDLLRVRPACGDPSDPEGLSCDEALARILAGTAPISAPIAVPIKAALAHVLARDIVASLDVPAYVSAAMDGYAIASHDLPVRGTRHLKIAGTSLAGRPHAGTVATGTCVRILTGAMVPEGCDTVVPQEHVETDGLQIRIDGRSRAGDNVRAAGEDLRCGETVLKAGRRISPCDLGLLASLGLAEILVQRPLRVATLCTGDELRPPGHALRPGEIYDSNRYTLHGMLARLGCEITDLGVVGDDPDALRVTLSRASLHHDAIITSGGVSVGDADHVRSVLAELGQIAFWKVAMKPGRPLTFGHLGDAVFFGLPGNPVAVMVTFYQFVQPALLQRGGGQPAVALRLRVRTSACLKKKPGRTEFQRGVLEQGGDGTLSVCPTGAQGSGMLSSMARANCFIVLPAETTIVEPGQWVDVQPFAGLT